MKKKIVRMIAILIAITMPVLTVLAVTSEPQTNTLEPWSTETKYDSPNINELTGIGQEPEDLSVSANAKYLEKAWYEYVIYSEKAVCSYRLNDDYRLLFYDPYTYTNAMVMEVNFDATTTSFDTMSSYTISKTNTQSISAYVSSTNTYTSATQSSGRDKTGTEVENGGTTKTIYNHNFNDVTTGTVTETTDYGYKLYATVNESVTTSVSLVETASVEAGTKVSLTGAEVSAGTSVSVSVEENVEASVGIDSGWLTDKETNTTVYSDDYKTTTYYTGDDTVEYNTTSSTEGWTELSDRITKTLGSSNSTSNSWSEEESVTVTKTYLATHFASDGVTPLPWAIVHYEVQMPMKVCMQVKCSGEWITISTTYCMLTTVKGTCRAWMENGQVYYEDWGSGEPVMEADFWAQFLSKEQLLTAYSDKLYPTGGED